MNLSDNYFGPNRQSVALILFTGNDSLCRRAKTMPNTNTVKLPINFKKGTKITITNQANSLRVNQNTRTAQIVGFETQYFNRGFSWERSLKFRHATNYTHHLI